MSTLTRTVLETTTNLVASPVSASAINLTWTANTRATGYRVYRNGTLIASPTTNSYSDSGLTASTSYTYSVSTVAATGEGPQTAGVQGTTLAAPDTTAPTAPVITATATGQTTISVALTTPATDAQSGVASYDLEYKRAADATYSVITPVTAGQFPYILGGLTAATQYNTRSRARDAVGNIGAYSAVSNATTQAATGTTYPYYSGLDLSNIPWHNSSGGWGAQYPLQAPTAPTTTRSVTVNSLSEFSTQANIAGTRITIATGWAGNTIAGFGADDIEVIIPPGVSIGAIQVGSFFPAGGRRRIRIRGSTDGSRGGRMGQLRVIDASSSDIIVEGVDLNGDSGYGGAETNQAVRIDSSANRVCFVNCRFISGGYGWLGGAQHVVIANCNMYAGAATRTQAGFVEGWGIRNSGGPIVIVDSRIQSTRYAIIRAQAIGNAGELLYISNTKVVAVAEGRSMWMWNNLNNGPWFGQGAIVENTDFYSYTAGGCGFGFELLGNNVNYSRVRNCRFYSGGAATVDQSALTAAENSYTGDHDWTVGNTFFSLPGTEPAWTGPGDPRLVPLPSGLTLISGEGACPGLVW